jgi:hypothetical protein
MHIVRRAAFVINVNGTIVNGSKWLGDGLSRRFCKCGRDSGRGSGGGNRDSGSGCGDEDSRMATSARLGLLMTIVDRCFQQRS